MRFLLPMLVALILIGSASATLTNYTFYDNWQETDQGKTIGNGKGYIYYRYGPCATGNLDFLNWTGSNEIWTKLNLPAEAGLYMFRSTAVPKNRSIYTHLNAPATNCPIITYTAIGEQTASFYFTGIGVESGIWAVKYMANETTTGGAVVGEGSTNSTSTSKYSQAMTTGAAFSFDASGNIWVYNLTIEIDANAPTDSAGYYQNQTNQTYAGRATLFSVNWTSATSTMKNYIFSYDNGNGIFVNDSTVNFAGVQSEWANVTKIINSSAAVIRWLQYAYDNTETYNVTPVYSFNTVLLPVNGNLNASLYEDWVDGQQGTPTNATTGLGRWYYTAATGALMTWTGTGWQIGAGNEITKSTARKVVLADHAVDRPTIKWTSLMQPTTVTITGSWTLTSNTGYINVTYLNGTTITVGTVVGNGAYQNFGVQAYVTYGANVSFNHMSGSASTIDGLQITGTGVSNELVVSAYDENLPTVSKFFNMTIANATNSTDYFVNYTWFNQSLNNLPSGAISITVKNASCQTGYIMPRVINWNTNDGGFITTAYLLCDGANYAQSSFLVRDQHQASVPGVTVLVQRVIGITNATITQLTTDSSGQVTAYLTNLASYYVTVSKIGYTTATYLITATTGTTTLPISVGNIANEFDNILRYANWTLSPSTSLDFPLFSVNSTIWGIDLQYYGMNLTLANTTQLYFTNITGDADGSTITSGHFNRSEWNGTAYATVFIGKTGYQPFYYTRTFVFSNQTNSNSSLTGILANLKASDMPPSLKAVVAIFFSLFMATGGMFVAGAAGAGFMFMVSLAFFGLTLGFINESLIYVLAIIALGIYAIQKGF